VEKSVFYDLYPPEEAFVMEQRAKLLMELEAWLKESGLSQKEAAKHLGVDQPRVSDIKNGKFSRFTIDKLIELAMKAGIVAEIKITRPVSHAA
jgi:predicted XRE-type DNA-binding protein